MHHNFDLDGETSAVWLSRVADRYRFHVVGGWSGQVEFIQEGPDRGRLVADGTSDPVVFVVEGDVLHVHFRGRARTLRYIDALRALAGDGNESGHDIVRAPMPGVVVAVHVAPGDTVIAGTLLMVIESMKLETPIRATLDGVVELIHVKSGESFDRDAILATLSQGNG